MIVSDLKQPNSQMKHTKTQKEATKNYEVDKRGLLMPKIEEHSEDNVS